MSVNDLMKVRKEIMPHVRKNSSKSQSAYADMMAKFGAEGNEEESAGKKISDTMDNIIDIRYYLVLTISYSYYL